MGNCLANTNFLYKNLFSLSQKTGTLTKRLLRIYPNGSSVFLGEESPIIFFTLYDE